MDFGLSATELNGIVSFYDTGITLRKNFFRTIPDDRCEAFMHGFPGLLHKIKEQVEHGRSQQGMRSMSQVTVGGSALWKSRTNASDRVTWFWDDGTICFIQYISDHDHQGTIARRSSREVTGPGDIHFDIQEFLLRIKFILNHLPAIRTSKQVEQYLCVDRYYLFSAEQSIAAGEEAAIEVRNVSIIGNAGSGKTLVGARWIHRYLNQGPCLYLTMSEELCKWLQEDEKIVQEFEQFKGHELRLESDLIRRYGLQFRTTHAIMAAQLSKKKRDYYKNPEQSRVWFRKFWNERITGTKWLKQSTRIATESSAACELIWKEIHGVIKGACPVRLKNGFTEAKLQETLEADSINMGQNKCYEEYKARKQSLKRDRNNEYTDQQIDCIYAVFRQYQQWLRDFQYGDDNDLARAVIRSHGNLSSLYAVFIDECQDLTEMQLLALFYLTRTCRFRKMASDRCQIIQPTFFDPGIMLSKAKFIDTMNGRESSTNQVMINANWRSASTIIALQNYTLRQLDAIERLKEEERVPIEAGPVQEHTSMIPVWIKGTKKNKEILRDIWQKRSTGKLNLLFAEQTDFDVWSVQENGQSVMDSKGMEYPAVLAWNVFSDKVNALGHSTIGTGKTNLAEALRYFYVAITRSVKYLFILEDDIFSRQLPTFLSRAYQSAVPLIHYCEDLNDFYQSSHITWKQQISRIIDDNVTLKDIIQVAEMYKNNEKYEEAIKIYEANGDIPNREQAILYCKGRILEREQQYNQALEIYLTLPDMAENIIRIDEYVVDAKLALAILLYTANLEENMYENVSKIWKSRFSQYIGRFFIIFDELMNEYPLLFSRIKQSQNMMLNAIQITSDKMKDIEKLINGCDIS